MRFILAITISALVSAGSAIAQAPYYPDGCCNCPHRISAPHQYYPCNAYPAVQYSPYDCPSCCPVPSICPNSGCGYSRCPFEGYPPPSYPQPQGAPGGFPPPAGQTPPFVNPNQGFLQPPSTMVPANGPVAPNQQFPAPLPGPSR